MARNARVDSTTEQVRLAAAGAQAIKPPAHAPIDDDAEPFWADIVKARAKSEWNDHDLAVAADLANAMAQLVENRAKLREEGEVGTNASGTPMTNPRVSVVHGLHTQVKSARQSLNIHGRAAGEARDVGKRRAATRAAEDRFADGADDLLARPATGNA